MPIVQFSCGVESPPQRCQSCGIRLWIDLPAAVCVTPAISAQSRRAATSAHDLPDLRHPELGATTLPPDGVSLAAQQLVSPGKNPFPAPARQISGAYITSSLAK